MKPLILLRLQTTYYGFLKTIAPSIIFEIMLFYSDKGFNTKMIDNPNIH